MLNPLENEVNFIAKAQRGDLNAFNRLALHYQDSAYSVAYRIFGERASAADAAQDAMIAAYRNLKSYHGGNFRAWLMRIVTNTCYDELRRQKRRPADAFDDLPGADSDDGPPVAADTPSPEQVTLQGELRRALEDCIRGLQADQRVVLVLSDVEGLNYQEIADSIGSALGTVKSRLSRARAAMRGCLQGAGELLPSEYRL
jgi:RNA polymerase sigma-70 factor (ECF subfamily)